VKIKTWDDQAKGLNFSVLSVFSVVKNNF